MAETDVTQLTVRERWVAAILMAVLAASSLWRLSVAQWVPDELVYARAGAAHLGGGLTSNLEHPPLAKLLFGLGQQVTRSPLVGTRVVSAIASVAIGLLLFVLLRRIAGTRAGLLALGLWALLPHVGSASASADPGRLDRFGMLDPTATALAMAAVAAGWAWLRRPHWRLALATGLLGGLAGAAKAPGVLVLPPIAMLLLWWHRDRIGPRLLEVGLAMVAAVAALALVYATAFGSAGPHAFAELVDLQLAHANAGHPVTVAGVTSAFPPWWSHLYFHVRDDGWPLALLLFSGAALAPWLVRRGSPGRRRGVLLLLASVIGVAVPMAMSPVKLPFYRYAWLPLLVGLLAVAADELLARALPSRHWDVAATAARAGLALGLTVVAVAGARTLTAVATVAPGGYASVARDLESAGIDRGRVLLVGRPELLLVYVPDVRLVDDLPAEAVVIDDGIIGRFPGRGARAVAVIADPVWQCTRHDDLRLCLLRSAPT